MMADLIALQNTCKVHNKYANTAPAGAVYIGRGSPYGNDFRIGPDGTRDDVIAKFTARQLPHIDVTALIGQHLICFCAPKSCHGDAIMAKVRLLIGADKEPDAISMQGDLFP